MIKQIDFKCTIKTAKNGNEFPVYSSKDSENKMVKTRFRKELIGKIPQKAGWYTMTVDSTDCNIGQDDYGEVLWIADVQEVKPKQFDDKVATRF